FIMMIVLAMSIITLYSAGRTDCTGVVGYCNPVGGWWPFAVPQLQRILIGMVVFLIAAFSNFKFWLRTSYLLYAGALALVIGVAFFGHTGGGATRWLNLGFITVQPSEFIKMGMVLVLARYFAWKNSTELEQFRTYLLPAAFVLIPFLLIVAQPDLGTALSLLFIAAGFVFIVGAKRQWFIIGTVLAILALPAIWTFGLHGYQKQRLLTFMNPTADLTGAGFQIHQARIAIGSGGFVGQGFMQGTQSQMAFLPERHTDFIFTMFGEEFGFIGAFILIALYTMMTGLMFWWAKTSRNRFGQLLIFGFMLNFFVYYFINIAMVLGLMPTVGVPLPLMSFGGSSLLALLFGFGLVQNARIHRDIQMSSKGG
ncbi:MAG: rod shape-determining protein RodA, partial [Alphaproteobacteria bacterium]|nr:rod shape-determining protein RodA [Alphaproteobacteria bacterium]